MSLETVSIQQARELGGLRLVVLRRLPSPWSQAAKGILRVKQLEATFVSPASDDSPGALEDWTGQNSFPAAVYEAGRRHLVGDALSALDIYWATFCNLVSPLPPEQLAMPEAMRPTFTATEPEVLAIIAGGLLEHRDFIYGEYLELPVQL